MSDTNNAILLSILMCHCLRFIQINSTVSTIQQTKDKIKDN